MASTGFLRLNLGGHFYFPNTTPAFSNHVVDAATEGIAGVFRAFTADPITHLGFRYGVRTGTPPSYAATIESLVATTGLPDGTDIGGGSPTSAIFTPPADTTWDGLYQWIALTNAWTPAVAQEFCATIRYSSGTIDGSNNSSFTRDVSAIAPAMTYPTPITNSGGTWTRTTLQSVMAYRTASGRYGFPLEAIYNTRSASTAGLRVAGKFTLPSGITTTCTLRGFKFSGSIASATGKAPIAGLWNAAGTVLQNVTLDSDIPVSATSPYKCYDDILFDESSLTALSPGTAYYIGLEVADAVNAGVLINGLQMNAAADMGSLPLGTSAYLSNWDGAAWTDNTLVRPFIELILDDMTAASGGVLIGRSRSSVLSRR